MTASAPRAAARQGPVRVMIVDDSAVVRGMTTRWLEEASDVVVAAVAVDGLHALKKIAETEVDVCVLDIEMPAMSGLEALPKLLAARPGLKVIMASTLSQRGAEVTLRALELGAADYIGKPEASRLGGADAYRRELVDKIVHLGRRSTGAASAPGRPAKAAAPPPPPRLVGSRPEALIIASSTGGPPALRRVLQELGDRWKAPVLIAQHMPAEFTKTLADMLDKVTPLVVREGRAGEAILPGHVYVAPGDRHMTVRRGAQGTAVLQLDQEPPINFCRPSADPLFVSAAEFWGRGALGLVLTGMGHDGRDGAVALSKRGGGVIAQDEASSVVWGMPGAVVSAGVASQILPLDQIANALAAACSGPPT